MKIAVPSLAAGRHEFRSSVRPREYGEAVASSGLEFSGLIDVAVVVDKMGEELFVRADVRAAVHAECARCLVEFDVPVAAHLEALYVPDSEHDASDSRASRAESESQRLLYYSAGLVDLGDQVIEAASLAVPMKPLCRADCRGLCPHCGANLNDGNCACPEDDDFGKPFKGLLGDSG